MIFLYALNMETLPFAKIQQKTERLCAMFYDSKQDNKKALEIFGEFEAKYPEAKFYLVDKQDPENQQTFAHEEFDVLPQVYILVPEEHLAEPMPGEFTRDAFESFIKSKFFKPDMSKVIAAKDKKDIFAEDGFVMFTKANCSRCDATLYSLAREAQLHGLTVKTIACNSEEMKEFCIEKGILRLPTTWISLDGVPSDGDCYTGSDCFEEYNN